LPQSGQIHKMRYYKSQFDECSMMNEFTFRNKNGCRGRNIMKIDEDEKLVIIEEVSVSHRKNAIEDDEESISSTKPALMKQAEKENTVNNKQELPKSSIHEDINGVEEMNSSISSEEKCEKNFKSDHVESEEKEESSLIENNDKVKTVPYIAIKCENFSEFVLAGKEKKQKYFDDMSLMSKTSYRMPQTSLCERIKDIQRRRAALQAEE